MIEMLWELPREAFWVAGFIGVLYIFGTILSAVAIMEIKRLWTTWRAKRRNTCWTCGQSFTPAQVSVAPARIRSHG